MLLDDNANLIWEINPNKHPSPAKNPPPLQTSVFPIPVVQWLTPLEWIS